MLEIIFYIFIFLILFLFIINKKRLLMCVVLINVVIDSITLYSEDFLLNPGIIRLFICFTFIFYEFNFIRTNKFFYYIIALFIFYISLALTNSSEIFNSITNVFKFLTPFIFYPLTIEFLKRDRKNSFYLNESILISIFFLSIVLIISQVYKLGESPYLDNFFYLGGMNIQIVYTLAYAVIFLLYTYSFFAKKKYKKIIFFLAVFFSTIFVVLIFRRVAIVSLISAFVFLLLSIYKFNFIKIFFVSSLISLAFNFFFLKNIDISDLVQNRQKNEFKEEGRYLEFILISEDMKMNGFFNILLGNEIFNSRDYFKYDGVLKMQKQDQLHTDVATLLHGSGILGLFFYLILFISMVKNAIKYASSKQIIFPIFPLILSYTFFSFSGQYYIFTSLTIFFVMLAFFKLHFSNYKV